jgi:hypothetical protein
MDFTHHFGGEVGGEGNGGDVEVVMLQVRGKECCVRGGLAGCVHGRH